LFDPETGALKPIHDMDDHTAAAISSVEVEERYCGSGKKRKLIGYVKKIRLWDKPQSLRTLAKHQGLLPDKLPPAQGQVNVNVQVVQERLASLTVEELEVLLSVQRAASDAMTIEGKPILQDLETKEGIGSLPIPSNSGPGPVTPPLPSPSP
jgi:hypothetical protein